jgi:signal transduction histidine kinase
MKNNENSNKKNIHVDIELGNIPQLILTDPVLLGDAVECIYDNAIKFSPPDSTIEIKTKTFETTTLKTCLSILILDQGPGIPAEQQQQMFEWFWQGEDSLTRCTGGMGIGLPLALRAIEILGGSLNYAQYPLGGSIFTITIPLKTSLP